MKLLLATALAAALATGAPAAVTVHLSNDAPEKLTDTVALAAGTYQVSFVDGATFLPSQGGYTSFFAASTSEGGSYQSAFLVSPSAAAAEAAARAQAGPTFTLASSGTITLRIGAGDRGSRDLAIADVGGDPAPATVPEPASWALMIAGFGAVGGVLRRRPALAARGAPQ